MSPMTITLLIGVLVVISFIWGRIPYGLTAVLCAVALQLTGVLSFNEAWGGFSNNTVFLFAAIFVLGAGLSKTSFLANIQKLVDGLGGSETKISLVCILMAVVLAIFMNATSATAALLPMISAISAGSRIPRSRLLMPVTAVAAMWVGVLPFGMGASIFSQNNAILEAMGQAGTFGFFDNAVARIPILILTTAFVFFVSRKLAPDYPETVTRVEGAAKNASAKGSSGLKPWQDTLGLAIFFGTVLCMAASTWTKWPVYDVAVIGAALMVIFGILDGKEAFKAIDVQTICIFAGMLSYATALSGTGAGEAIANWMQATMGTAMNAYVVSALFFFVPFLMTQVMNNIAVDNLLRPLAAVVCVELGMDPRGPMIAVTAAACLAVCTPMACAPMALIMEPGQYKFVDYLKHGIPVAIVFFALYMLWMPLMFPPFG
ncbi:MAG: anion:sodium symporter [Lachnospiraceae bacterium]|jgi:sodium-dependent dicarboxylate transporter 2/3/5|nr:anion:sodium symporter [Lachnospiraceae bacterium]